MLSRELGLNSVCVEASCPNKGECWKEKHITFMILGNICTRSCSFCNITSLNPGKPEADEPERVAKAIEKLGIKYTVITSVTRDDLADKGASHFVKTVSAVKERTPDVKVELLIPDIDADPELLGRIAFSGAEVIGHNIEMPEKLYTEIRPDSYYGSSLGALKVLSRMRDAGAGMLVKTSIMLGLGEEKRDIYKTLEDLKRAKVDIVYLGQYLNPSDQHWPVKKYYEPAEFVRIAEYAENMGFKTVLSGPMVRSSYRAMQSYEAALGK